MITRRAAPLLAILAGTALALFTTAAYLPGDPQSNPNLLVNPAMELDQANEGTSLTLVSGTPAYIVDGWKAAYSSSATGIACQRVAEAPAGFANSLKCTVGTGAAVAAGHYLIIEAPIEASQLTRAALGTASAAQLCLSWQAKSSIGSYTMGAALTNFAGTRSYPSSATIASAATWTPMSLCFNGDLAGTWVTSGNAGGAYVVLTAAAGGTYQGTANAWSGGLFYGPAALTNTILSTSGATFQVTGVKLEISPVPTPFARRDTPVEWLMAQRYYWKSYSAGTKPGSAIASGTGGLYWASEAGLRFAPPLRCTPAVTVYDNAGTAGKVSYYNAGWLNGGPGGPNVQNENYVEINGSAPGAVSYNADAVADCRL